MRIETYGIKGETMKINKDLIVEIPIRFKKGLADKWSVKNIDRLWLTANCPLCEHFKKGADCGECPFSRFQPRSLDAIWGAQGCGKWILKLRKSYCAYAFTPAQLKSFLIKAKAHIRWIK